MNQQKEGTINFVVIPIEVLQDKELTFAEKVLYAYLTIFRKGVCFQSNATIAEAIGCDEKTVSRGLQRLSAQERIFVEFVNNSTSKRRIYTIIEDPKKMKYLSRKGFLNDSGTNTPAPTKQPAKPLKTASEAERIVPPAIITPSNIEACHRQLDRKDYPSEEAFQEAFYARNTIKL